MSHVTRRQLLASLLGNLAATTGTVVVLAHTVLGEAPAAASEVDTPPQPQADLQERADQVAGELGSLDEEEDIQAVSFVNGGFRNGGLGGGGFRKGAFANGGFGNGGFRKGAFANGGGGGGFRNGGFANGGGGGGFRKGAFRNF
jgi:hypothetical protein